MVVGLGFQNVTLMQKMDFLIRGVVVASGFDVDVHNEGKSIRWFGAVKENFWRMECFRRLFDS
jgi:hypothetical protein